MNYRLVRGGFSHSEGDHAFVSVGEEHHATVREALSLPETAVPQNEAFSVPLSARAVLDRLQGWRLVGIAGPEAGNGFYNDHRSGQFRERATLTSFLRK
ncbi:hypothetical protein PRIPAC_78580 [Pristionchus pacificus]|uniref:Uncharacterized protein n=1 Tax=Pristionchus pacificus TaxID=54126 RepID=A0A2A6BVJ6_PRIPA|nr:hypothetical protein PRIPAC_78580 [Pristionchus pacificus]|eukprot:PDM69934.1 hypothetical protein PRIPAC_49146 [Pristionchus pacificus]